MRIAAAVVSIGLAVIAGFAVPVADAHPSEPGVVIAVVRAFPLPENQRAREEDDCDGENNSGHDHHPRCGPVEPGRLFLLRRWRR